MEEPRLASSSIAVQRTFFKETVSRKLAAQRKGTAVTLTFKLKAEVVVVAQAMCVYGGGGCTFVYTCIHDTTVQYMKLQYGERTKCVIQRRLNMIYKKHI